MTNDAVRDLDGIVDYVAERDLPKKAIDLFNAIAKTIGRLSDQPNRGARPKELAALGIRDYREVYFKPYRIIYRVVESEQMVYVYLIADGRRNLQTLLARRLLQA